MLAALGRTLCGVSSVVGDAHHGRCRSNGHRREAERSGRWAYRDVGEAQVPHRLDQPKRILALVSTVVVVDSHIREADVPVRTIVAGTLRKKCNPDAGSNRAAYTSRGVEPMSALTWPCNPTKHQACDTSDLRQPKPRAAALPASRRERRFRSRSCRSGRRRGSGRHCCRPTAPICRRRS